MLKRVSLITRTRPRQYRAFKFVGRKPVPISRSSLRPVACFLSEPFNLYFGGQQPFVLRIMVAVSSTPSDIQIRSELHGSLPLAFPLPVACLALSTTLRNEHCLDNGCLSLRILLSGLNLQQRNVAKVIL